MRLLGAMSQALNKYGAPPLGAEVVHTGKGGEQTFYTAKFPGTYGQARYGFAIGTMSGGDLWLQNESGVIMHLKAKRTGLMLSLGGDAVVISMQ